LTRVAAAVVNFNAGELLAGCVRSLLDEGVEPVVVVDSGSTDGSLDAVVAMHDDRVAVMRAPRNAGYGAGANRAVRAIVDHHRPVLVCNPDIVVHPGAPAALAGALDADPALGVVGPRLINSDGSLYPSARTFPKLADAVGHAFLGTVWPNNPFSRRYKLLDWDHETGRTIDWVSGACFLIRRDAWDELGGFDQAYFMYMEDVDLCWRAWKAGWGVAYEPKAEVTHVQGASTDQRAYRMIVAHHLSMLRFAARTTTGPARLLLPVMAIGMAVRTALACAHKWRSVNAAGVR
jgi:N-acetylglucosaminyl-diphospho-decaprenol L-rhamnosyltransferase